MGPLMKSACISVLRSTYNTGTQQTSAPTAVPSLANIRVYIQEIGTTLRSQGISPVYTMKMLWHPMYDIRDGDQIIGYNPGKSHNPPILQVSQPETSGHGTSLECRRAMLAALPPAGVAT